MERLYEIGERYQNLAVLLEDPDVSTDEVLDALAAVEDTFNNKVLAMARMIRDLEAQAAAAEAEAKRLATRKDSILRKVQGTKEYMRQEMDAINIARIKDELFTVRVQNNPASVNVTDENLIPGEFFIQKEPELSKKLIGEALKAGKTVPGAELMQTRSLRIA